MSYDYSIDFINEHGEEFTRTDKFRELRQKLEDANKRIRAWTDGMEPPALEDDSAIGPPDIKELVDAAPRFTGDRKGGPVNIKLETYEAVVSRSEIVAYGRALAWQQQRIAQLEKEHCALAAFIDSQPRGDLHRSINPSDTVLAEAECARGEFVDVEKRDEGK